MNMQTWQPTASLLQLKNRAAILQQVRTFFAQRNVLEVDTPLLDRSTVTDPVQKAFQIDDRFLQTSPEYAMKRLLASHGCDIYQICKAFRDDEVGRIHNPEFTMLEWYRIGYDLDALMRETADLLQLILRCNPPEQIAYQQLFLNELHIDPLTASVESLKNIAHDHHIVVSDSFADEDKDTWLDILMSHVIEPKIGQQVPTFIYDYPASQAALAKTNADKTTARRFEIYYKGIELANGYHELTDAAELEKRFHADNNLRSARNLPQRPIDYHLIAAQKQGIPDCSGVALGLDRLIMLALNAAHIREVLSFVWED
jgi:elongation factor P--(R)-beta-lysine ligase